RTSARYYCRGFFKFPMRCLRSSFAIRSLDALQHRIGGYLFIGDKYVALPSLDFMASARHPSCMQLREPFHRIALLQDALQNWNELPAMGNSEIVGSKLSGRQRRIVQRLA